MKKSLIALAVLAASGAAMAQSSVTLYGVADVGLVKSSGISAQMTSAGVMNNGTNRLGVRGVEDLGGGLKASFNFEQGINAEDGALTGGAAGAWNRAAWLAIEGGFGRFQMGRTLNPSFYGLASWELTGTANYSAVGTQFGFTGQGPRTNSLFQYTTPNLGGFSGTLGYIMKPDNGGNAKYDLNAIYRNGPLVAALSYNKTNTMKGNMALGASYDFGMAKVAGSIQNNGGPSKGFTIGATVPVGAFALTLDIARENGTGMKNTDFLLEAKYALSKRTFAYAAYYKDGDANGAAAGGYATGAKNHIGLGVRHNF
ncbi:MAG: porin [Giesbergeria sp.]|jgi:predicted porin|nr:porin [Giesbergeria sp.]